MTSYRIRWLNEHFTKVRIADEATFCICEFPPEVQEWIKKLGPYRVSCIKYTRARRSGSHDFWQRLS